MPIDDSRPERFTRKVTFTVERARCAGTKSDGERCTRLLVDSGATARLLSIGFDQEQRGVRHTDDDGYEFYCAAHAEQAFR